MSELMTIRGAGGGGKGGSKNARKPYIQKDSVSSVSTLKALYGLSEGEVEGLVDGAKSIYLEGTPLVDDNGNDNFTGVSYEFVEGTNEQDYIKGFPDVSNEIGVNVELKQGTPYVKAINNTQLSATRVRLRFGRLAETNAENGDITGTKVEYAIDLQTDGSAYETVVNGVVNDKASAGYERTHRIDLPKANTGWQIRVRRLTPNSDSDLIQNDMFVDAIAEVIDAKLRYPNTAMLGLSYDAETFQSVAKVAVHLKGKRILVPSNYNAFERTYTGLWNGTFKEAYSNNPAWVMYDLLTQWRYGLGDRIDASMVDKWSLYQLGQYCDQMVDDGKGGQEPRFTCNVYLQKQEDAFTVLSNIAGIFRAMSYWNGERIVLDADMPQDPVYTFSRANVVDGLFNYTGSRARDRHTLVKVAWDNPANNYQTEYEFVRDERGMAKYGVRVLDLSAFACTSQAQAQRAGLWALETEQLETRQVSFAVGLDGFIPQVGNIVNVSDELFAGRANGGRVSEINGSQITLDREVTTGDTLVINGCDGRLEKRTITAINGNVVTVNAAFNNAEVQNVWAIESADLMLMQFRVMSITQNDDMTFNITALQHEPQKYDAIDYGVHVEPTPITVINPDTVRAPEYVNLSATYRVVQGQNVATLVIEWEQVKDAVAYEVEWRKDNGTWIRLPRTGNTSIDIEGIYSGKYQARVRSISAFDVSSQPKVSNLTDIKGKVGKPNALTMLRATGLLFGMRLDWEFAQGSGDTAYTEIEQAIAPDTNVSLLGQFSYPTDNHDITGLQGGLTLYYRARIVDKLGFKSDWTEWVSGVTDNNAEKVLDLISGQITESHLYDELGQKIDKIDANEAAIAQESQDRAEALRLANQAIQDEAQARIDDILQTNDKITAERNARIEAIQAEAQARLDAIQAEANTRAQKISNVVTQIDNEQAARINAVSQLQDGINTEVQQRKDADITINNTLDTVISRTDDAEAAITAEAKTRADADNALSQRVDTVVAKAANNESAITSEAQARADADDALTSQINTVSAKTDDNLAAIQTEAQTRSSNDDALSTRIDTVVSSVDGNTALIQSEAQTRADETSVLGSKIDGVYAQVNPPMAGDDTDLAGDGTVFAGVWSEMSARIEGDLIQAQRTDELVSRVDGNAARISEVNSTLITKNEVVAQQISDISAQMTGGYGGDDLSQVTSGLIHQERQARATAVEGLAEQISLLSAGVGEQFDPFEIWHFDNDDEGWNGGVYNSGYINARTTKLQSPTIDSINSKTYKYIKFRIEKVGNPTWSGLVEWSSGSKTIGEPEFADNIATVDVNTEWSGDITGFGIKLAETADNLNYYKVDWIAVGRPSPGASYAALLNEQTARANADDALSRSLTQLQSQQNQLSSSISQQLQTLTNQNESTAQSLETLKSGFDGTLSELQSTIINNYNTLSTKDNALSQSLEGIYAQVNPSLAGSTDDLAGDDTRFAGVWSEASARIEGDLVQAERLDALQSQFNNNNASITEQFKTLVDKDNALAEQLSSLNAEFGDNKSSIDSRLSTITDDIESQATQQQNLSSTVSKNTDDIADAKESIQQNAADITTESQTRANQDSALGRRIDTVVATASDNTAAIASEQTARANADSALTNQITQVSSKVNANESAIQTESQTRASQDNALSQRITTVQSSTATAQSTADNALSKVNVANQNIATIESDLSAVTTQSGATAESVETLQTTVNGHTSSIQTQQTSIDGLSAESTLTLDVNGYVTGVGSYNDGKKGTFAVRADEFWIGAPDGSKYNGFVYYSTPQTINGVTVPRGLYLDSARIADASIDSAKIASAAIDTAKLKDAAITSAKIDDLAVTRGKIANLAVDSAKIQDAAITSAKIGNAQVDTLQIKGEAVVTPRHVYNPNRYNARGGDSIEVELCKTTMNCLGGSISISWHIEQAEMRVNNIAKISIALYAAGELIHTHRILEITDFGIKHLIEKNITLPPQIIPNVNTDTEIIMTAQISHLTNSVNVCYVQGATLVALGAKR